MDVIERIKSRAKEQHLSVAHICNKLGVNRGFLRDVENGKCQLKNERLNLIADILETTPEYLRGETEDKNKPVPTVVVENELKKDDEEKDNDIKVLIQLYKGFSDDNKKKLVSEAFYIWQKEHNND